MKKFLKETFIILLLATVVFLTLSMIFYDFINENHKIPEVKQYVADSDIKSTLEEIDSEAENNENRESLLKSYEIVSADLKNYASKKSYEKGKANPFLDYEEAAPADGNTVSNTTTGTNPGQNAVNNQVFIPESNGSTK